MSEANRQDCAYCLHSPCACPHSELAAREYQRQLDEQQYSEEH